MAKLCLIVLLLGILQTVQIMETLLCVTIENYVRHMTAPLGVITQGVMFHYTHNTHHAQLHNSSGILTQHTQSHNNSSWLPPAHNTHCHTTHTVTQHTPSHNTHSHNTYDSYLKVTINCGYYQLRILRVRSKSQYYKIIIFLCT